MEPRTGYDILAPVYDWLVPDALLTPEGDVAAFEKALGSLPAGARVLDCAAGPGRLAVGLALAGFTVTATDASRAMIDRTAALAAERDVPLRAVACTWEELAGRGWEGSFDAVLCVGNSLVHAAGRDARRAALRAMAGVLVEGGRLVVTSRDWETVRRAGSRTEASEGIERGGRRGSVTLDRTVPRRWAHAHTLTITVDAQGRASPDRETLAFWPFHRSELRDDLAAAGLAVESWDDPTGGRYLVTARTPSGPSRPRRRAT